MFLRFFMHVACTLNDTRILFTHPDVSQMHLTFSVTFQENTCILTFCMYFTRIDPKASPKESEIHIRYIKIT